MCNNVSYLSACIQWPTEAITLDNMDHDGPDHNENQTDETDGLCCNGINGTREELPDDLAIRVDNDPRLIVSYKLLICVRFDTG